MQNKSFQKLEKNGSLSLKQTQRLMISQEMQQALHLLQLPVLELSDAIYEELSQNPLLEEIEEAYQEREEEESSFQGEKELNFEDSFSNLELMRSLDPHFLNHFSEKGSFEGGKKEGIERFSESEVSLFALLMKQAKELCKNNEEERFLSLIIGNLDERGFLETPLEEISLLEEVSLESLQNSLKIVQSLEPLGIGAKNLQESLLLQLLSKDKKESLAYQIIENHYDDLLNSRTKKIQQGLKCSKEEIKKALHQEIKALDFSPGTKITHGKTEYAVPDLYIKEEGGKLFCFVNDKDLPEIGLKEDYISYSHLQGIKEEDKRYIEDKISSAKWFMKNIFQRNRTLEKIGNALIKKQGPFFLKREGKLQPLNMKSVALEIEMHESTVARAIGNKYVDTPKGLFPLKHFFSSSLSNVEGEKVSSHTVKEEIKKLIEKEDKKKPYSDEDISERLKEKGIFCARRTVAKFRSLLLIGNTLQRRE